MIGVQNFEVFISRSRTDFEILSVIEDNKIHNKLK